MVCSVYTSAVAFGLTNRLVLLKSCVSSNGGFVGAGFDENIISGAIAEETPLSCSTSVDVECPKVFNNIILDKRVLSPAINCEVAVAIGPVGSGKVDGPRN